VSEVVLELRGLSVRYGGVTAVNSVDLTVGPGELVGLIGPNGAGKTSLIDAVTGFAAAEGRVCLGGRELSGAAPPQRARAGLARTWQSAELFDELTVRENLAVAAGAKGLLAGLWGGMIGRPSAGSPAVAEDLRLLGLERLGDLLPEQLTQGQRKLVGVARALAAGPRLLLLDEPAAGLNTDESARLGGQLREVVGRGVPIVLVDHDMGLVFSVCDRVVVLDFGKVIAYGSAEEVRRDRKVAEAYLGTADPEASELAQWASGSARDATEG
jgi:branched-chain amino acid transport system ATP-binding protein